MVTALIAGALSCAQPAAASDDPFDGDWHFSLAPYIWVPGMSAELNFDSPPGATGRPSVGAGPTSVLQLLNFAFMGTADARKDNWGVFTDFIYVDLGDSKSRIKTVTGPGGVIEIPINVDTKSGLQNVVFTLAAAYAVHHDRGSFTDVFLGTRYMDTRASVDWSLAGPLATFPVSGRLQQTSELWDAIAGIRGRWRFGRSRWFLGYYGDAGTGSSDLTLQGVLTVGYAFDWGDLGLGFRDLYYKAGSGELIHSLNLYGPTIGARFRF
jgi:hypothetical protein